MYLVYLFWLQILLLEARKLSPKPSYGDSGCDDGILEGDCNISQCLTSKLGNACEARFVRFNHNGKEYSRKTCRCLSEPICSLVELSQIGCVGYKNLTRQHQKVIRRWTMTESERQFNNNKLYGNEYKSSSNSSLYSDQLRHQQIINGSTKFCCRIDRSVKKFYFHANKPISSRKNETSQNNSLALIFILLLIADKVY